MDTVKCKALLCAVNEGSLTAAAEKLGYTPSGISRMAACIEKEAGFPILLRSKNGVTPTREGKILIPILKEIIKYEEKYIQTCSQIRGIETGHIVIGTAYSTYYHWFSRMIAEFIKLYPGVSVEIIEGTSSELSGYLENGKADFCIISRQEGKQRFIPLRQDRIVAWLPKEHILSRQASLSLKVLEKEPYIEIYPDMDTDNSRLLLKKRICPNTQYSTKDIYAAYSMVEAGLGITLINEVLADLWQGEVITLPLEPEQPIEIGIAIPKDEFLSPAASRFIDFALKNRE